MPVLSGLENELAAGRPFEGKRVAVCCHLEAKTAYLIRVMQACGAHVLACASNPLSTQDDVVAALVDGGADVYAVHGETMEEYEENLHSVLQQKPQLIVDDGGDLVTTLHQSYPENLDGMIGGSEETTTGVLRLKAMEKRGELKIPMILVNDAQTKFMFDNRYGTGQSVWDGINRTTNLIVAGKQVVGLLWLVRERNGQTCGGSRCTGHSYRD